MAKKLSHRERYARAAARQHLETLRRSGAKPRPARITMALNAAGLWGPEVDEACGVSEPAVDEWETGARVPTWEQLERLAELTGMAVAWFFEDDPPPTRIFLCRRGQSRCEVIDTRPDAEVVPIAGQLAVLPLPAPTVPSAQPPARARREPEAAPVPMPPDFRARLAKPRN